MKIKTWLVRGDTHGNFAQLTKQLLNYEPEETAVIILGDFGANFYLNKTDARKKKELNQFHYYIYAVRGNHEARPQNIPEMKKVYDEEVEGYIYYEPEYPYIRYFLDYGIYNIQGYSVGIIGGAYSVDKWYRLNRFGIKDKFDPDYINAKKTGWFYNEQLNTGEMEKATQLFSGKQFDFIMSHTCPYSWRPVDMFLSGIDQSTVDNSMELWMDKMKDQWKWKYWLWGHFHRDSIEAPHCEMLYNDIENLDDIVARWKKYDETGKLDWWLMKSPYFEERVKLWWLIKGPFYSK